VKFFHVKILPVKPNVSKAFTLNVLNFESGEFYEEGLEVRRVNAVIQRMKTSSIFSVIPHMAAHGSVRFV